MAIFSNFTTRRRLHTAAQCATLVIAFGGAPGWVGAADTLKLALVTPVNGPLAQHGEMQTVGLHMAVAQINQAGGVNGKQLEAVVYDDACDPKQAVAIANKVVNDGIRFVVGHLCSSATMVAASVYDDEQVLLVTAASTHPDITRQGYPLVFRTIGLDSMQAPVAAAYIADKVKPRVIAVLHDKQQYGEGLATSVKRSLESRGMTVDLFEGINAGDRDYSTMITKLKQIGVDWRQSAQQGLNARWVSTETVGNKELSAIAGPAVESLVVTMPRPFDEDPKNQPLVQAFKAKNQDPSGLFVLTTYAAVQVIAEGIQKTGAENPQAVAKALHENTFDTPIGMLAWDERGDLKEFNFIPYRWHQDATRTPAP